MLKITIIIATYNAAKTLRQTLESIKEQTYSNIELIVIDGKSTDNTVEIIKEYGTVISKWISEPDTGIYNAWNKALHFVTGDYIAFIGADDCYCHSKVIENIAGNIDEKTNILSTPIIGVNEIYKTEQLINNRLNTDEVLTGKMVPHPGMFVKTSILQKYKFNEKNKIISDYEFLLQYILAGGDIKFIDEPSVYFSNAGISSVTYGNKLWKTRIYEHILLYDKYSIDREYLFKFLDRILLTENLNIIIWHIKYIIKIILFKIKLVEPVTKIFNKHKKHKCNLKYCRWCARTDKK